MDHTFFLTNVIILLAVAVGGVYVFKKLKIEPILAYLLAGMLIGPFGLGLFPSDEDTQLIAELGVVFLLFMLGLEFSLSRLMAMRTYVVGLGSAQVILTTLIAFGVAIALSVPVEAAIVIGGMFALSSTAIVIKQLGEQLELSSRHGQAAIGVLLFQDIAVIPFLIIVPMLADGGNSQTTTGVTLLVGFAEGLTITLLILLIGHYLLRPLFHAIARTHSAELFTLSVLLLTLLAAAATHSVGLSMALGAFLAGMMLSETEFKHQIEIEIRPFRDIFLALFFVSIGMLLNLKTLPDIIHWVILLTLLTMTLKALIILGLAKVFALNTGVALRTGLVLSQCGEFGFALAALAFSSNLFDEQTMQVLLATIMLSMFLSPWVLKYNGAITRRVYKKTYLKDRYDSAETIAAHTHHLKDHIIIIGFGRVGQNIASLVSSEGLSYVALDIHSDIVKQTKRAGHPVFFGNAIHPEIIKAADIAHAKALVITHHHIDSAKATLNVARALNPDIPIIARLNTGRSYDEFMAAGATAAVPDEFEASLMLNVHLLYALGIPLDELAYKNRDIRETGYAALKGVFKAHDRPLKAQIDSHVLENVELTEAAYAVGKSIEMLNEQIQPASIKRVCRGEVCFENPSPDTRLKPLDVLSIYGTREEIEVAQHTLLTGSFYD